MIGRLKDHRGVTRIFNHVPSLPTRLPKFEPTITTFPPALSLMAKMPPIRDQLSIGSCTAFSAEAPLYVAEVNAGRNPPRNPSPLFLYYCERALNGQIGQDSGANIADIYKASHQFGVCPEELWPYDVSKYTEKPSDGAYQAASTETAHIYAPVPLDALHIKGCLNHGFPISFGIVVYDSFMADQVAKTGIVPMPGAAENPIGGHAIDIVSYNDGPGIALGIPATYYKFRNSWSDQWGDEGYGYLPYAYVHAPQLSSDGWMIRAI